jgi:hypothetical protein
VRKELSPFMRYLGGLEVLGSVVMVLLLVSPVFASNFSHPSVNPQNIPYLGTTGITFTKTAGCTSTDTLHRIAVTDPNGAVFDYNLVANPQGIRESFICGQSTTVMFGPSSPGWVCVKGDCAANPSLTEVSGTYSLDMTYGVSNVNNGNTYFVVGVPFNVPEFAAPLMVVASLGLLSLALLKKFSGP